MKKTLIPLLIVLALLFSTAAVASQSKDKRDRGLGISESYQNPNTYLIALPVDGKILDGRFTNVRFRPLGSALFDEPSILFCGDVAEQFSGKAGTVAVMYRTQASGMYEGIGCHTLLGVFRVAAPKEVQ